MNQSISSGSPKMPDANFSKSIDSRAVGVGFIFASIGVMAVTLSLSLFVQNGWAYAICALIYVAKIAAEHYFKIISPLSIAIFVAYAALMFASFMAFDIEGYTGVYIFSWLLFVVSGLHAIGKPFTSFYSLGKGSTDVHKTVSMIWILTYAFSFFFSIILMPNYWFVLLPVLLCIFAAAATLFVSFFWCGRRNERATSFERDGLRFYPITAEHPDFEDFCLFYAKGIMNHPRQEKGSKTLEESTAGVRTAEINLGDASMMFVCKDGDKLVGTIRCVVDTPGQYLPTEKETDSPFDALRKHGKIMEVGRLAIHDDYRGRSDIINGLFSFMVNLALERDVMYVISSGFAYVVPIYMKIGFSLLFKKSDRRFGIRRSHGFVAHPVILDFYDLVFTRSASGDMKFGMYQMAQPYLAERWFKRAIVRFFVARVFGQKKPSTIDEIREILIDNLRIRKTNASI